MIPPQIPLDRLVPLARRAEELGYDLLACGEHVFFHVPATNAFVALAAAAGATSRIRLLSAVTLLPTYPAALAAKMAATLDGVSGGRFEFGVGVGGEFPAELRACGIAPEERGPRTTEGLEVMARLFAGETLTHEGRFARYDGVRLDPLPVQRPGPPMWVGGRGPASLRRAARFGDVWLPYMVTPAQLADGLGTVRAHAAELGRPGARGALFCWGAVGADGRAARRTALDTLGAIYRQDFAPLADRYVPAGTPAEVTDRLREYADAGAETVLFAPACPADDLDRSAEIFAHEVAPALVTIPVRKETGSRC
ncbi:LLM class flavin-dependent oxidoreductase [Pseudonocardia acidicola]|uniref:LLM class flavin-dependent oxidoreductase n=1 Tax=Pseudonocardia acidicola TaxID=2724939 RepID=A0ABX1SEP6_9PSEU|nr:LLM class flavin-dependent oxidoreductase [Pseudonocardia acidicola]NMH98719.1 LLM class flavin-dependent oxidoreductase [Pseudonocardia acidicola]